MTLHINTYTYRSFRFLYQSIGVGCFSMTLINNIARLSFGKCHWRSMRVIKARYLARWLESQPSLKMSPGELGIYTCRCFVAIIASWPSDSLRRSESSSWTRHMSVLTLVTRERLLWLQENYFLPSWRRILPGMPSYLSFSLFESSKTYKDNKIRIFHMLALLDVCTKTA